MLKISSGYMWAVFTLVAVLSMFARSRLWMLSYYYPMLLALAGVAVGVGILLVRTSNNRWRTVSLVVLGLLVGQWWFTEQAILTLGWLRQR